jgi:Mg-chelatase subunit ChlD
MKKFLRVFLMMMLFFIVKTNYAQKNLISNQPMENRFEKNNSNVYPLADVNDWFIPISSKIRPVQGGCLEPFHHHKVIMQSSLFEGEYFFKDPRCEYLETKLAEPLQAGKKYYFEFHIRHYNSYYGINNVGALFKNDSILTNGYFVDESPQVLNVLTHECEMGWQKVSGCFIARGGEQFVMVGHFPGKNTLVPSKIYAADEKAYLYTDLKQGIYGDSPTQVTQLFKEINRIMLYSGEATYHFRDFMLMEDANCVATVQQQQESFTYTPAPPVTNNTGNLVQNPCFDNMGSIQSFPGHNADSLFKSSMELYYINFFRLALQMSANYDAGFINTENVQASETYSNYNRVKTKPNILSKEGFAYYEGYFGYHKTRLNAGKVAAPHRDHFAGDTITSKWIQPTDQNATFYSNLGPDGKNDGYVGMNVLGHNNTSCHSCARCPSYMQTRLVKPLEKGKTYHIEFYMKLDKKSQWKARNVGALFTKGNPVPGCNKKHNLILVVDVSASMYNENHIEHMKTELEEFVLDEGKDSRISLITFGSQIKVLMENEVITDMQKFHNLLGTMHDGGGTDGEDALIRAYQLLRENDMIADDVVNNVVLFSDGGFSLYKEAEALVMEGSHKNVHFAYFEYGFAINHELKKTIHEAHGVYAHETTHELNELLTKLKRNCGVCELTQKPQFISTDTLALGNDMEWTKVSGCFKAEGGEQYMTVGSFYFCGSCPTEEARKHHLGTHYEHEAYYYYDNFLLREDSLCNKNRAITSSKPDNVTILVDISSSMYNAKYMDELKSQLEAYISGIGKTKKITLITCGGDTKVIVENQNITNIGDFHNLMEGFGTSAATDIAKAIRKAYATSEQYFTTQGLNQVVLFTDAKFELTHETDKIIANGHSKYKAQFLVYQFGNYNNKELQQALKKYSGVYVLGKDEKASEMLLKMGEVKTQECSCSGQTANK